MRVIIEAESVLSALNSLRKDAHLSPLNPLMQFHSIHEQHFLDGADAAANRVYETLRGIIRNRVNHYRRLRDIPPLKRETHHDNLIKALNRDFSTESDELRAWSVLYYRYIELDLELSVAEFALASNFSSRMLLRHQTLGVKRLTRILVRREERYRAQQRLAVLRGMLPVLGKLYGRDGLLNELYAVFVDAYQGGHRPLLLRGVPGVGKSSIAVALAERVIKETEIKQVVWIDRPEPVADTLLQRIAEQLSHALPTSGSFTDSLVAFLHMRSTLIVLDHAQDLLNASDELAQVIRVLSAARVILCTDRLPAQRPPDMIMRVVPPLDKESAFRVMEDQLSLGGQSADPNMLEHTYNQLGGVPGALRMAMLTSNGDVSKVVSADLFEPIWNGLSADARLAWMLIHLIRPHKDVEFTATLPSGSDPRRVLTELERVGVFERPTFESLMLTPMARAFVNGRITAEQEIVPRAIELAADHLTTNPDVSRIIHFLNCIQLSLSPKLVDLAYAFAPYVERAGEWVAWYRYLNYVHMVEPRDHWVALHLGVALRWLGRFDEAYSLFGAVAADTNADKLLRGEALIELAVLARLRNALQHAKALLEQAAPFYERLSEHAQAQQTRLIAERIQVMLALGQVDAAMHEFDYISDYTPRLYSIGADIALRLKNFEQALQWAEHARQQYAGDAANTARMVAKIGHIHYETGNFPAAIDSYTSALNLMETSNDPFGHARVRLNLASVYIRMAQHEVANAMPYLLHTALRCMDGLPQAFEVLKDTASLQASEKNLELIRTLQSLYSRSDL